MMNPHEIEAATHQWVVGARPPALEERQAGGHVGSSLTAATRKRASLLGRASNHQGNDTRRSQLRASFFSA
jgi:hypothetical protein